MGDSGSTKVFSIDVGIVNIGVTYYDGLSKKVLFAEKLSIAPSLKALGTESEIIPRVFKLLFDSKSPYYAMIMASKIVLIENQMKSKMKIIQHVIGAICFRSNIEYMFVDPRTIKAHFSTGAFARKKSGTTVKGLKNNHGANKKMAKAKAKELFPEVMKKIKATKQDDVADALLQAKWYADVHITGKKRKRE
jgi:hypothetical protein